MSENSQHKDIIIAGGGPVGLCLSVALRRYCPRLSITIIEPKDAKTIFKDSRSYAIGIDCYKMLRKLGIWQSIEQQISPINNIKIFEAEIEEPMLIASLDFRPQKTALAYMIKAEYLHKSLYGKAKELGVEIIHNHKIIDFKNKQIELDNGKFFTAELLVAGDGSKSLLRKKANINATLIDYKQKAISCTLNHEYENNNVAIQYFFKNGPFAILPLPNKQVSIIWSENQALADKFLSFPPARFMKELQKRFGNFLGKLEIEGDIQSFPLYLNLPHKLVADNFLLIGDAAHFIHPICGQGINLGLRDCATAAQLIVETSNLGLPIGDIHILQKYQQARRTSILTMGFTTHLLNNIFSNDREILKFARNTALHASNKLFNLKSYLIDQANGKADRDIKLLQGFDL